MDVKEEPPSAERREQAQPCDATRKTRKTGPKRKKAGCGDDGDGQAKRKRAKAAAEPVEKRLSSVGKTVPWRPHPNEKTRQRILRALPGSAHRMFLLEHKVVTPIGSPGGGVEEFVVLGATANVYTVTISRHSGCTCPDFAKGNLCKHVLFVMIRVLKMDSKNPLIWQKALLSKEVDLILSNQQENCGEAVMASGRVLGAYKKIASQEEQLEEEEGDPNRKPVEGDCPVCYEELKEGGEALVWCNTCGNNIHKVCFTKWSRTQLQNCGSVTCVYCRSPWEDGSNPGKIEGVKDNDGYVNLRDVSQHHNSNNTSLDALYGDTSMWVEASMGLISRRNAARLFHAARGEF